MKRDADHEGRIESAGPLWDCVPPPEVIRDPNYCGPTLADCIAHGDAEFPRERAELRRDLGIERAAHAAERHAPGWEEQALAQIGAYATRNAYFLAEDVRATFGTPAHVDGRAWGSVLRRAVKAGLIVSDGFAPANSSNRSPKVRWRSLVFQRSTEQ